MSLLLLFAGSASGVKGYSAASDAASFSSAASDAFALDSLLYPWSTLSPGDIIYPGGLPGGTGSSSDSAGGGSSASDA